MGNDGFESGSVTLNSLLEEQRALNMRMLLAVQLRDLAAQETLQQELEELAGEIERFLAGRH
ncbi:hypothetical protein [uncultured Oscillibacter sp.]|uniref:hypothetical protein n=1 Tax=uncultured Oscillibacter sp. TaxID=876091 RepID=UPI002606CFAC|nr:hypothetical protein [uncultured Oscillibacter sp.]